MTVFYYIKAKFLKFQVQFQFAGVSIEQITRITAVIR